MGKITSYAALAALATNDLLLVVDVNDTSMAPTGTDKNLTIGVLGNYFGIVQPSGDTSGATDTSNIQALLNATGRAYVNTAAGPFYIGTGASSATGLTVPTPGGGLIGTSGGFTNAAGTVITAYPLYYLGNGVGIKMAGPPSQGTPHAYPSNIMGGELVDFVIDGSLAGGSAVGLQYGNGDSIYVNRVRVANFGGVGIHELSNATNAYTEKSDINVQSFYNTIGYQFDSPSPADNSHWYSRWNLHVEGCTIGVQFLNSAGVNGGNFRMFGNFYPGGGGGNGIAVDFSAGVNNSGHFDLSQVVIQVETTGSGSATFQTVRFGTNGMAGFNNCFGMLRFVDSWTNSDLAATGRMSFGGVINNNDTTLTTYNSTPAGWL